MTPVGYWIVRLHVLHVQSQEPCFTRILSCTHRLLWAQWLRRICTRLHIRLLLRHERLTAVWLLPVWRLLSILLLLLLLLLRIVGLLHKVARATAIWRLSAIWR